MCFQSLNITSHLASYLAGFFADFYKSFCDYILKIFSTSLLLIHLTLHRELRWNNIHFAALDLPDREAHGDSSGAESDSVLLTVRDWRDDVWSRGQRSNRGAEHCYVTVRNWWLWFVWLWLNTLSTTGSCSGNFVVFLSAVYAGSDEMGFLPFFPPADKVRYGWWEFLVRYGWYVMDVSVACVTWWIAENKDTPAECGMWCHLTPPGGRPAAHCLSDVKRKWGKGYRSLAGVILPAGWWWSCCMDTPLSSPLGRLSPPSWDINMCHHSADGDISDQGRNM